VRSAPGVQRGNVQAAVGAAALKRDLIGFMQQVGIENQGTVGAVGNRDGRALLWARKLRIADSLSLHIPMSGLSTAQKDEIGHYQNLFRFDRVRRHFTNI